MVQMPCTDELGFCDFARLLAATLSISIGILDNNLDVRIEVVNTCRRNESISV